MLAPPLVHFLSSYLSVAPDPTVAARTYIGNETPDAVRALMSAIRQIFEVDPPEGRLRSEIERASSIRLPDTLLAREFLLRVFSTLSREAGFSPGAKAYDVFISYSSRDQQLASWLASELRSRGYSVWLDRDEILVGHSILDAVYRGIMESEFLVVLLTRHSVSSKWVKEELTAARLNEIENAQVTVLPVKCEPTVEIPAHLRGKRLADITESRERGLDELLRAIDLHRAQRSLARQARQGPARYDTLREWHRALQPEPLELGFDSTKGGYKDFVIGPVDGEAIEYDKRQLLELLDKTRVRIKGWGGAPFPYEVHPKAKLDTFPDGLRLIDTHTWVFSVWNFHYWRLSQGLRFFQRTGLYEDGDQSQTDEIPLRSCLSVIWTVKDVCMALMFAANVLKQVPSVGRLVVIQELGGMAGRRLVVRGFSRAPLYGDYVSASDTISQASLVDRSTDLESEATRVLSEIFWLFSWQTFRADSIASDVRSFLAGQFPPNW